LLCPVKLVFVMGICVAGTFNTVLHYGWRVLKLKWTLISISSYIDGRKHVLY